MDDKFSERRFSTKVVWSGTNNLEGSAVTPIFTTSTYQLSDERYRKWAEGAQHTLMYSRYSSVNSEAVAAKVASLKVRRMARHSVVGWRQYLPHYSRFFPKETT